VNPRRVFGIAARAVLAGGLLAWPGTAIAQPEASDTGYDGTGDVVVQTSFSGASITIGGNIALEERGARVRLDVLSLALPGTDPTISALAGAQLFPPGGFTIVYDRRHATYTVWSSSKRAFYVGGTRTTASAGSQPPPHQDIATTAIASGGDLFGIFGALRGFKDDRSFSASVTMTGHTTLFGHPVTGLTFRFTQVPANGAALDAHGELELADDLDAVPIRVAASITAGSIPASSLRLDLTTLAKATPPDTDFAPPPDYARATSLGDVIGRSLP
jgi:hypothetical protein